MYGIDCELSEDPKDYIVKLPKSAKHWQILKDSVDHVDFLMGASSS
jgi:hypothetical protein